MCFFILYNVEKERGESTGNEERRPTTYYSERGEGIRDEEGAPTAYYCYVEVLLMKYMMPYTRSEATSRESI